MTGIAKKATRTLEWQDHENDLIRRIHRKIGGSKKLAEYDNPTDARDIVLKALAEVSTTAKDKRRIEHGDLTPLERRVVRKVTNRCAAGRSRTRRQREIAHLREELRQKQSQIMELQLALRNVAQSGCVDAILTRPSSPTTIFELTTPRKPCMEDNDTNNLAEIPTCPLDVVPLVTADDRDMLWSLIVEHASPMIMMSELDST